MILIKIECHFKVNKSTLFSRAVKKKKQNKPVASFLNYLNTFVLAAAKQWKLYLIFKYVIAHPVKFFKIRMWIT